MPKFQVVSHGANGFETADYADEAAFIAGETAKGRSMTGRHASPHTRVELANHPKMSGLYGPMWGGQKGDEVTIRYEDAKTYDIMSR